MPSNSLNIVALLFRVSTRAPWIPITTCNMLGSAYEINYGQRNSCVTPVTIEIIVSSLNDGGLLDSERNGTSLSRLRLYKQQNRRRGAEETLTFNIKDIITACRTFQIFLLFRFTTIKTPENFLCNSALDYCHFLARFSEFRVYRIAPFPPLPLRRAASLTNPMHAQLEFERWDFVFLRWKQLSRKDISQIRV